MKYKSIIDPPRTQRKQHHMHLSGQTIVLTYSVLTSLAACRGVLVGFDCDARYEVERAGAIRCKFHGTYPNWRASGLEVVIIICESGYSAAANNLFAFRIIVVLNQPFKIYF